MLCGLILSILKVIVLILTRVESGVRWSYTSWEAEELSKALMGELKELSEIL